MRRMNREVRLYCGDCGKVPYWESLDSGAPPRICDTCMALRELISHSQIGEPEANL
mgnify:CR=1 FL=1